MNYFDFYKITPAFEISLTDLRKRYYEKSRELHPDVQDPLHAGLADVDYLSALNNQAYKTLLQPLSRLKYLLETEFELHGLEATMDDPEFLVEMMDLHEFIQEALICEDEVLLREGQDQLKQMEDHAQKEVEQHLIHFDEGDRSLEIKNAMQSYYNKLKYFTRLRETMERKTPEL